MPFQVVKTYGHNEGWSCAYRNWRAKSHCNLIHGYALSFEFTFEAEQLDECYWTIDFGALKPLKGWLQEHFDHKFYVADDDPNLDLFEELRERDLIALELLQYVSCEAFAEFAYYGAQGFLMQDDEYRDRVKLISAKCAEHPGNAAIYKP